MKRFSKLIIFFLIAIIYGCEDNNIFSPIPNVEVNFYIDLNQIKYSIEIDGAIKIDKSNFTKVNSSFIGFKDNGIIIYRVDDNTFGAYDAICPYCMSKKLESSVTVKEGDGFAKCPDCKSEYYFPDFYPTIKSVSEYQLKRYRVQVRGYNELFIFN